MKYWECKLTTETNRELIRENRFKYEDLKRESADDIQVGNVLVYKYDYQCVFNLIIKETFDSRPYMTHISKAFRRLKNAMDHITPSNRS